MDTPEARLMLAYEAAAAYYTDGRTQAEIAHHLGVSRPTVSRLLEEARSAGLVTITVHPPSAVHLAELGAALAQSLGLRSVRIAPGAHDGRLGRTLLRPTTEALQDLGLNAGDVLVVASGRTVYELSLEDLPSMPGVVMVPGVGGQADPEPWFQTNEIVRAVAKQTDGRPTFLFAEAMPSPAVFEALRSDPGYQRTEQLWSSASAALLGIGAPPRTRSSMTSGIPVEDSSLRTAAGDICLHFFDHDGGSLGFPGSEHMVRIPLETLLAIPQRVAVAAGAHKTPSIIAAARMGCLHHLVTDEPTAQALAASLGIADPRVPTTPTRLDA